MVFNATFNNISAISWRPVLLVEETWVTGENHRPAGNLWQTLSYKVVCSSPSSRFELTTSMEIGTDYIGSCKSNCHAITTTMAHITLRCSKVVWCCKLLSLLWFRNRWYDFTFFSTPGKNAIGSSKIKNLIMNLAKLQMTSL